MTMTCLRILTIAASFLLSASGCGQDKPGSIVDPDPPPDYSAFDKLASWSGAHDLIAYVHGRAWSYLDDPDSSGIYLITPDGSGKRQLLMAKHVHGIDWSPDGQWIIANAGSELWKISYPDAVVETLLTAGQYYYPTWCPDGTRIASAVRAGDEAGIHVVNADGSNYRRIIPYSSAADWPYVDSLLYLNLDYEFPIGSLCMADSSGAARRVVYDSQGLFQWQLRPKMHIYRQRIIFKAQKPGEYPGIWKLELPGSDPAMLIEQAEYPELSPDGNQVVFTRIGSPYANLWIINWDGTGLRELTESLYH
jgi:Tol biopolymer transport system component